MEFEIQGVRDAGDEGVAASRAQVEVVRAGYEAFNRRRFDIASKAFDADVEWIDPPDFPGGRTVRGREAVERHWASMVSFWEQFDAEVKEIIQAGEDWVIVLMLNHVQGRAGVATQQRFAHVWMVRDGRVTQCRVYTGWDQGLEEVGLRE
jgi:ketosteroid isomerase-like protein